MRRLALALLLPLAGCTAGRQPTADPADGPLPVVRVTAGVPDTLALGGRLGGARFGAHPSARVRALRDGRVVVETPAGFSGLAQVPLAGRDAVLVVESRVEGPDAPSGTLRLDLDGPDPEHPDILQLTLTRLDAAGREVPSGIDEEAGIVALLGDRPFQDNAIDAHENLVRLDLDAAGPGRQRLRLAARVGGLVSNWIALDLVDGRLVSD